LGLKKWTETVKQKKGQTWDVVWVGKTEGDYFRDESERAVKYAIKDIDEMSKMLQRSVPEE
jgi:hypothetical protein